MTHFKQVNDYKDTRENGDNTEKVFAPDIKAESHARIFYVGQSNKISDDGTAHTVRHTRKIDSEKRNTYSLHNQLRKLVEDYNE